MATLVLKLLKTKFAAAGAVLIIAMIVVLMGPRVGLVRPYNYIAAAVILLGWLGWLSYQKLQAKKNASALEGFLHQQADDQLLSARPDVKDEIAALKEKLERAVRTLKQSKLAKGRRGAEALYVLPWFMIIGPSACGKSTAIRESGLSFPPIDPDAEHPGAIKGLGGTRNCDWWFTNEGIILDTAGRYTIPVDAAEDREEWTAFLSLLKRFRKKSPINGLLVMVSVDELMRQSEEGIEAHARNIRVRIDELINKLEIIFPVYLVFTKCDLVSGFVEFFGDFKKREREQVWGYTCKYDPERAVPAHEEFERETDSLLETLKVTRIGRLHAEMRPGNEKRVFLFPLEFDAARRKLRSFVETLFQPNPFQQNPALRGVYFTSGTQEGTPIGQVMESMAREFEIPREIAEVVQEVPEKKAYFIKDLFSQIIMTDSAGVRQTSGSRRRGRWVRAAVAGALALLAALFFVALGSSYVGNRNLLQETAVAMKGVKAIGNDAENLEDLRKLDRIRRQFAQLDNWEDEGAPWSLRWGLYKGDRVNCAARNVMLSKLTPMLLQPTVRKIESYLDQGTLDDRFWAMGPIYLALTQRLDSADLDVREFVKQANYVWGAGKDEAWLDDFQDPAGELIQYWWKHHLLLGSHALAKNTVVFERVKWTIRDNYDNDRVYADLISEAGRNLKDIEIIDLVSGSVLTGSVVVEGAYTTVGWETEVQPRIKSSREDIEKDVFKLEALADELDGIEDYLFRKYISNYKREWQEFLDGLTIAQFTDISRAKEGMDELSDPENSAIFTVLKKAAENSVLLREDQPDKDLWGEFEGINRFFGRDEATQAFPDKPSTRMENYTGYLGDAVKILDQGGSALGGEQDCGKALRQLANDLAGSRRDAEGLIRAGGSGLSRKAGEFLGKPFGAAQSAAFADACQCLNAAWKSQVYDVFQDELAEKYPFNKHGAEADPGAVVAFFGRGGALQKFQDDEAEPAERAGLQLPGSYTQALRQGERIREVIAGNGLSISFVLIAESPTFDRDLESVTFKFGSDRPFEYHMGGTREQRFTWSGADQECSLSINPSAGNQPAPLKESGPWSLFRLFNRGEIAGNTIAWSLRKQHDVQYKVSGPNANFILDGGFIFSCPSRVCGGG